MHCNGQVSQVYCKDYRYNCDQVRLYMAWPDEQPTTVLGRSVEVKYDHVVTDNKMTRNSLDRSA